MNSNSTTSTDSQASLDVLFVDDSTNLCRAMELWLTTSGYSAETAGTAAEAERIATRRRPRVVIADLGLPDATGYELYQRLIQTEGMSTTCYIALSGRRGKAEPRKAIQSGFETFIAKPPDFEELSDLLHECLPNHNSAPDLNEDS